MIVISRTFNAKVSCVQFICCLTKFWFLGSSQKWCWPLTSVILSVGVSPLFQISQHLFSCTPFDVLCDRRVVPVTGWPRLVFVRPTHLCCVLSSVSLSLCSALFFPAPSFCPLSMIWWALHCSVLKVSLLVCACVPSTLCEAHERALSHNFLNEDFVNTVL